MDRRPKCWYVMLGAQGSGTLDHPGAPESFWPEPGSNPIPYYTILYYTILYDTILYYTILYYTILYYTILYYTIL